MKHASTKNVRIHAKMLVLIIANVECKITSQLVNVLLVSLEMHSKVVLRFMRLLFKIPAIQVHVEEMQFVIMEIAFVVMIILEILM